MKARTMLYAALLMCGMMAAPASAQDAKEGKKEKAEVTFLVSMTCENCQKRIEDNISFEKGVTALDVNLPKRPSPLSTARTRPRPTS